MIAAAIHSPCERLLPIGRGREFYQLKKSATMATTSPVFISTSARWWSLAKSIRRSNAGSRYRTPYTTTAARNEIVARRVHENKYAAPPSDRSPVIGRTDDWTPSTNGLETHRPTRPEHQ